MEKDNKELGEVILGVVGEEITINDYCEYLRNENKEKIAELVKYRLYERYLKPFELPDYKSQDCLYKKEYKSGFSIMANCCLCIEALQSYKNGLKNTRNKKGDDFFNDFFNESTYLKEFADKKFYKNVRCGILHQGETTGGWRIRRDEDLLNGKTINANRFLEKMIKEVGMYCDKLKEDEFDSVLWKNCMKKMDFIIKNCKSED